MAFLHASVFAAGVAAGAVGALWWALDKEQASAPGPAPVAAEVAALAGSVPERPPLPCTFDPLIPPAEGKDGRARAGDPLPTADEEAKQLRRLIVRGKERAAAGRPHDAEVAFLQACRLAERDGEAPARVADAKYQLARHYSYVARSSDSLEAERRAALLERSERLYADSLRVLRVVHGDTHEKTRFAALGLERVRTAKAGGLPPALEDARQAQAEAEVGAEEEVAPAPPLRAALVCTGLGSREETAACARAELARLGWQFGALAREARERWQLLQAEVAARRAEPTAAGD